VVGGCPALRALEHQLELAAHPILADELLQAAGRREASTGPRPAALAVEQVVGGAVVTAHERPPAAPMARSARAAGRRCRRRVPTAGERRLDLAGGVAERDQRRRGPRRERDRPPCRSPPATPRGRAGTPRPCPQLEHEPFGDLLADAGDRRQRREVGPSRWRCAGRRPVGPAARPAPASARRPTVSSSSNSSSRGRSGNPYSVIESSRTCSEVCSSTSSPRGGIRSSGRRGRGSRPRRRRRRPPASRWATVPRTWRSRLPPPASRSAVPPARSAHARRSSRSSQLVAPPALRPWWPPGRGAVARVRSRAGEAARATARASAASAGRGCVETELGDDHAGDRRPCPRPVPGDGGLDVRRGQLHDRQSGLRGGQHRTPAAWPVAIAVRTLLREQHPLDGDDGRSGSITRGHGACRSAAAARAGHRPACGRSRGDVDRRGRRVLRRRRGRSGSGPDRHRAHADRGDDGQGDTSSSNVCSP
jgi:hypothetical protein